MPAFWGYGVVGLIVFMTVFALFLWWKKTIFVNDLYKGKILVNDPVRAEDNTKHSSNEQHSLKTKTSDFRNDINPKSWLSKYRQTTFGYLIKMALFYSAVGMAVGYSVYVFQFFIFGYEEPSFPFSLITAVTAGPIEETLFFGIPYSLSGNQYVVLITGGLWASMHLFNSQELVFEGFFANSNFAFALFHIFFSLRTWKSGKGWFVIFFHAVWNAVVFGLAVAIGENPFMIIDTQNLGMTVDTSLIVLSVILMAITYPLYKWRIKREAKKDSLHV